MEGPTPVSALIHAATMVAAGIYMLCRIDVVMVPSALTVISWVGTATALYAALCAITQRDIKKVLAYSTLSQLGYMVAAFGLGSSSAAMFHLTTHAFFKALLFLGSGSVIFGCHHEQDIFRMGGLRTKMPVTFWTFTIGVAAIIGLPGLAGFFSKDAILVLALERNPAEFAVLALTAILTSFYMLRLWKLVFLGAPRSEAASHAHEGGIVLTAPLLLLAVLAAIGGYTRVYPHAFAGVLAGVPEAEGSTHYIVLATSLLVLLAGAGAALALYASADTDALETRMPALFSFLTALKLSFDRFYDWYVAKVQQRVAIALNFLDIVALAGGVVRGVVAGSIEIVGFGARALHTGRLSTYVYWFLGGVVVLWAFAMGIL
jgi:NADH-quinone oxidoreductase subunit L